MFRVTLCLVLFTLKIGGVSVPSLAGCAVGYLSHRNSSSSCEEKISTEITKFYDEILDLITRGANLDNLENSEFVVHQKCIITTLRYFNVSDLFLKGIAYEEMQKVHASLHSFNHQMTSQQILLLYSLQVCEPRSFYARHAEKIFTLNMRTNNAEAHCLLKHLNKNSGEASSYQFSDDTDFVGEFELRNCDEIVRNFMKKYYNVIDRARSFSIFGLNPEAAMKCRASNDKNLINHMILLTIFPRLIFTPDQIELEKIRFFEIARDSARSFFECISMYD